MSRAYSKIISYEFSVDGEAFLLFSSGLREEVLIEDARKNGQEDTHLYGSLVLTDGVWKLDESSVEHLNSYFDPRLVEEIENYIAKNGIPNDLIIATDPEGDRTVQVPTFEEAWAEKEREGYQYGEDTLEQVRLGWEMRASIKKEKKNIQ